MDRLKKINSWRFALWTQDSTFWENIANWKLFSGKISELRFLPFFHAFGEVEKKIFSANPENFESGHFRLPIQTNFDNIAKEVSKFDSDTGFGEISIRAFRIRSQNIFIYFETKVTRFWINVGKSLKIRSNIIYFEYG